MSVRFFIVSSSLLIFSWLAVAFLTAVPLETYPAGGDRGAAARAVAEQMAVTPRPSAPVEP